jgi:hypothetical protein
MKELIAYETWHGVMWLRWRRSRQDLLDEPVASVKGKLSDDLVSMDRGNGDVTPRMRFVRQ